MGMSDVQICNWALARVGITRQISTLLDTSAEAKFLNLIFATVRDSVLEDCDWQFARRRSSLTASSETRVDWSYIYPLPSDCIAVRKILTGIRNPRLEEKEPFTIELSDDGTTKYMLSDAADASVLYTARVASGLFSGQCTEALCWKITAELAASFVKKPDVEEWAMKRFMQILSHALATIRNSEQEDVAQDSEFITFRGG